MDQKKIDFYIDFSNQFFDFLIELRQWSGFGHKELNLWMKNFAELENGKYLACRILNETLGYSEEDMVLMVEGAISDILNGEVVKEKQINSGFAEMKSLLEYELKDELKKTLFVPLSVNDAPGESGAAIIRLITQKCDYKLMTRFQSDLRKNDDYKRIILVDDCIGSGEQFKNFWDNACIKDGIFFKDWCVMKKVKVYYLVLVGDEQTIEALNREYTFCKIVCVELLNDGHKVIKKLEEDAVFKKEEENLLTLLNENNINLRGFNDMEYAVFMNNNIPDWSLPVLHKSRTSWSPLLRRKDSNV